MQVSKLDVPRSKPHSLGKPTMLGRVAAPGSTEWKKQCMENTIEEWAVDDPEWSAQDQLAYWKGLIDHTGMRSER